VQQEKAATMQQEVTVSFDGKSVQAHVNLTGEPMESGEPLNTIEGNFYAVPGENPDLPQVGENFTLRYRGPRGKLSYQGTMIGERYHFELERLDLVD
jgi:hypothetical protein